MQSTPNNVSLFHHYVFKSGSLECNIDVTSLLTVKAFVHHHEYVMTFLPTPLEKIVLPPEYIIGNTTMLLQ